MVTATRFSGATTSAASVKVASAPAATVPAAIWVVKLAMESSPIAAPIRPRRSKTEPSIDSHSEVEAAQTLSWMWIIRGSPTACVTILPVAAAGRVWQQAAIRSPIQQRPRPEHETALAL